MQILETRHSPTRTSHRSTFTRTHYTYRTRDVHSFNEARIAKHEARANATWKDDGALGQKSVCLYTNTHIRIHIERVNAPPVHKLSPPLRPAAREIAYVRLGAFETRRLARDQIFAGYLIPRVAWCVKTGVLYISWVDVCGFFFFFFF